MRDARPRRTQPNPLAGAVKRQRVLMMRGVVGSAQFTITDHSNAISGALDGGIGAGPVGLTRSIKPTAT